MLIQYHLVFYACAEFIYRSSQLEVVEYSLIVTISVCFIQTYTFEVMLFAQNLKSNKLKQCKRQFNQGNLVHSMTRSSLKIRGSCTYRNEQNIIKHFGM